MAGDLLPYRQCCGACRHSLHPPPKAEQRPPEQVEAAQPPHFKRGRLPRGDRVQRQPTHHVWRAPACACLLVPHFCPPASRQPQPCGGRGEAGTSFKGRRVHRCTLTAPSTATSTGSATAMQAARAVCCTPKVVVNNSGGVGPRARRGSFCPGFSRPKLRPRSLADAGPQWPANATLTFHPQEVPEHLQFGCRLVLLHLPRCQGGEAKSASSRRPSVELHWPVRATCQPESPETLQGAAILTLPELGRR